MRQLCMPSLLVCVDVIMLSYLAVPHLLWIVSDEYNPAMQIESLSAVAEATNNEVTLSSLGSRFTAAAAQLMQ